MSQKITLARMYISDQDKTPLRIDKRNWVKQHNFSTQTLYDGLRELAKEMDISKYVVMKTKGKSITESSIEVKPKEVSVKINSNKINLLLPQR